MSHLEQVLNTQTSHSEPPPKRKLYTKEHTQSTITEGDMSIRHTHTQTHKKQINHTYTHNHSHTHTHTHTHTQSRTLSHTPRAESSVTHQPFLESVLMRGLKLSTVPG